MKITTLLYLFITSSISLFATPSNLFWTICTTDVYPTKVTHLNIDTFFSVGNRKKNGTSFPPDIGVTYGLFTWNNIRGEVGVDYVGGIKQPWLFNAKVGLLEDILFKNCPSFSVGVFDVGTSRSTNLSVVDAIIGKTLPNDLGRLFYGLFHGKRALGKHRSGWMAGYQKGFYAVKDEQGKEYNKWWFIADYSSGKNLNGGAGFCLVYFFNQKVSMLSGPVWFTDTHTNGRWKWSVQFNVEI